MPSWGDAVFCALALPDRSVTGKHRCKGDKDKVQKTVSLGNIQQFSLRMYRRENNFSIASSAARALAQQFDGAQRIKLNVHCNDVFRQCRFAFPIQRRAPFIVEWNCLSRIKIKTFSIAQKIADSTSSFAFIWLMSVCMCGTLCLPRNLMKTARNLSRWSFLNSVVESQRLLQKRLWGNAFTHRLALI